jgi:hypothetical protein
VALAPPRAERDYAAAGGGIIEDHCARELTVILTGKNTGNARLGNVLHTLVYSISAQKPAF